MEKALTVLLAIVLLLTGGFFGYEYINDPKIVDGRISTNIDDSGKPVNLTAEIAPEDTVHFSAKQNRFWIKKAQVVWYKGEIDTKNRYLVVEDVDVNKAGYFTTELSVPEGLESGRYGASVYVDGAEIMETTAVFNVK